MLTKKAVKLLRKVEKNILARPKRFNMNYFDVRVYSGFSSRTMLERPPCNTQACIGGEVCLAAGAAKIAKQGGFIYSKKYGGKDAEEIAPNLLQLDDDQRKRLFYFDKWTLGHGGWPAAYEAAYNIAKTPIERAHVAVARIEHFIATEGDE